MTIASYLTGPLVSIRALEADDAKHAGTWHPAVFGINAHRGEAILKEEQESFSRERRLGVVLTDSGELVGGLLLHLRALHAEANLTIAPTRGDADELRAAALQLVIPWLRDEAEYSTISSEIAADWPLTIAAAEALGMLPTIRLREWLARPGGRTDLLVYQVLNPFWEKEASLKAIPASQRVSPAVATKRGVDGGEADASA